MQSPPSILDCQLQRGEKRLAVIDCAAYAQQDLRMATMEIHTPPRTRREPTIVLAIGLQNGTFAGKEKRSDSCFENDCFSDKQDPPNFILQAMAREAEGSWLGV
jgi:hypothetical protein